MESSREQLLKPYTTLSELITTIFQHKGINLSNLTLGEVNNAISSDKLSAGEKQMLSFICYNAFTKNNTIFIDEPELSLHPDWQRTLVPTLLNQGNNNQFFMATHSPFIYSKYSDKEIILSNDKGI
jgi:predicted ATP-binding protein involved in virulence